MIAVKNHRRGVGLSPVPADTDLLPSRDAGAVAALLALCPAAAETPLRDAPALARRAGIAALRLKDESPRMGLGSFKALGAAYAIACDAQAARAASGTEDWSTALAGRTYATASAGNHGLSVAAGARVFGAQAVIYLAASVPKAFAERLRARGARVERAGEIYEQSMAAAAETAETQGWTLLSDSSWPGYAAPARRVMEGYLQMAAEAADRIGAPPTHVVVQAGVGGMAAAVAAHVRARWGDAPLVVVVEPEAAPALLQSVLAGRIVDAEGPVSAMGRLDCKTPSLIALNGLARDADVFATVAEEEAAHAVSILREAGVQTTPSGAAGVAALLSAGPLRETLGLTQESRALAFVTEGPEA
ncbi:MAG: pyridoxal-phosphate dependent enzyme [Pseudomonadota bacterium]